MKQPITIKDIARELNISPSTVSRALADNPVVKLSTREAVKNVAQKFKYTPNITALNLRHRKTTTLGIIVPFLVHEYFASIIRGIEDYAYDNGYNVIVCSSHDNYEREVIDTKSLLHGRIDGLLACVSSQTENFDHFKAFEDQGIPLVFFDCVTDKIKTHKVVVDDLDAGFIATKHLIDQGCENIAYVGGPASLETNKKRFAGYQNALATSALGFSSDLVVHCKSGDFLDGQNAYEQMSLAELDGIFAGTDMLAVGTIKAAKRKGIKIPNDLKVVGFSDWKISSIYEPSLSTIRQPGHQLGLNAAELLIDQINNPENENFETQVLKTELITRESSKRP